MAVLYGLLNKNFSGNQVYDLENMTNCLNWSGAVVHKISFYTFSGGIILNPTFQSEVSDFVYQDYKESILVLISGHFYNKTELINSLGIVNNKISNPEIAFRLFKEFGNEFANQINGDFTIIIYQQNINKLMLFRDHLGIIPLSYSLRNAEFWFSSDGLGMCKALYNKSKINPDFLLRFVKPGDDLNLDMLPHSEVKKLKPGHYLEYTDYRKLRLRKYWFPEKIREDSTLNFDKVKDDLNRLLKNAVSIRATKSFLPGTHLSGGLDSGIVAALARENYPFIKEFKGFSWSTGKNEIDEVAEDERNNVESISRKCNIKPLYLEFDEQDVLKLTTNWRMLLESYHEAIIRKAAKKENVNLLFSGWGGDEFISINSRGIDSDLVFQLQWKSYFQKNPIRNPVKIIKRIILKVLLPSMGLDYQRLKKPRKNTIRYLRLNPSGSQFSPLYKYRSRRSLHLAFLNLGHLSERTEFWFINGYAAGIEYRYPLLDKRIVEYMLKVPSRLLFKNGYVRLMLREISAGILPDNVTWSKNKINPAVYVKNQKINKRLFMDSIQELDEYKKNPDLNFVNFYTLEEDIKKFSPDNWPDPIPEYVSFTIILRYLNEFTKGYYSNSI